MCSGCIHKHHAKRFKLLWVPLIDLVSGEQGSTYQIRVSESPIHIDERELTALPRTQVKPVELKREQIITLIVTLIELFAEMQSQEPWSYEEDARADLKTRRRLKASNRTATTFTCDEMDRL